MFPCAIHRAPINAALTIVAIALGTTVVGAANLPSLAPAEAEARLRVAMQIARERNDRALVAATEDLGRAFRVALPADAESRLRDLERRVGIDPGGWSMAGQPIFRPAPEMSARLRELSPRLTAAMQSGDRAKVEEVCAELRAVLGDQAGVPDGRRPGHRVETRPLAEAAATNLFLRALRSEDRRVRPLLDGKPLPDQMPRFYGYLLEAVVGIRPLARRHNPDAGPELDRLAQSLAKILLTLQQPDGHFPFPDLRGKNVRFGDMTSRLAGAGKIEVRDGWIVSADPDGGSQFDTGVCGVALMLAGKEFAHEDWKRAGRRAADWALGQPCCANFNYNAFSVSLLAQAYRQSGERKYLDAAWRKYQVGIAPGQAPNGRWLDPHNARTVYHAILLRALGDLAAVLPAGRDAERTELARVSRPAVRALLDEFAAMGVTVEALPELLTLSCLEPGNRPLRAAVELVASSLVVKSSDGERVRMGAQPHQLAAVARVWP